MKLKSYIPIQIDIGEEEKLLLGVKRLNYEEANELRAKLKECENAKEDKASELLGQFLHDSFRRFVRLECKMIMDCADGEIEIRKAEDLLEFFGGMPKVMTEIICSILAQNSLSELQKKVLPLVIGSSPSSVEPEKDPAGPKPVTTAPSAGSESSAGNGDAMRPADTPSGSMQGEKGPSSSTNAQSVY